MDAQPTTAEPGVPTMPPAESLARRLAAAGREVTLQGTVVHRSASRTLAMYALLGAAFSLLGVHRPDAAVLLLALLGASAVADLDGGRGWLRGLRPKSAAHNVVIWPRSSAGPLLLIAAPLDAVSTLRPVATWLLRIPVGLSLLGVAGCALMGAQPEVGEATLLTTAICLGVVGLTAAAWPWIARSAQTANPARVALELTVAQVERTELDHLRCAFAFIGDSGAHCDGLETLLKNYRHRLRQDATRVLMLQPDAEILGAVHHEGRIRRHRADPLLIGAMRKLGLAGRVRTTGASRARRSGWRAAAMTVGPEQTHAAAGVVAKLAQVLDAGIGDAKRSA